MNTPTHPARKAFISKYVVPVYRSAEARADLDKIIDAEVAERTKELSAALAEAVELIKAWHNMDTAGILTEEQHEQTWEIYQNNAPEMKRINALLHGAK